LRRKVLTIAPRTARIGVATAVLLLAGCCGVAVVSLPQGKLPIRAGPPPADSRITAHVEVRLHGASIFGVVPLGKTTGEAAVERLVKEAVRMKADGLAELRLEYTRVPFPLAFIWWYRGVRASAFCYRLLRKRP